MDLKQFSFELPQELIAAYPAEKRDHSKLLLCKKNTSIKQILNFYDIPNLLNKNCHLVFNNVKVINARLFGKKISGGNVEIFLNRIVDFDKNRWEIIGKKIQKLKTGSVIIFDEKLSGTLIKKDDEFEIEFNLKYKEFDIWIKENGHLPLPPYILKSRESKSDEDIDYERYQTVYAKINGAVAAPTAGLHFTNEILEQIKEKGVTSSEVTLHVGLGTFMPVKTDSIEDHKMHTEYYEISEKSAEEINKAKQEGKKIICVGTTSLRALESAADESGVVSSKSQNTSIFIYPGYKFKITDGLITNFHLPESTLLMLVSALHGKENILDAYSYAVENKMRFYSYGDSMFISPF